MPLNVGENNVAILLRISVNIWIPSFVSNVNNIGINSFRISVSTKNVRYRFRRKKVRFVIFVVHANASESSFLNTENLFLFSPRFIKKRLFHGVFQLEVVFHMYS